MNITKVIKTISAWAIWIAGLFPFYMPIIKTLEGEIKMFGEPITVLQATLSVMIITLSFRYYMWKDKKDRKKIMGVIIEEMEARKVREKAASDQVAREREFNIQGLRSLEAGINGILRNEGKISGTGYQLQSRLRSEEPGEREDIHQINQDIGRRYTELDNRITEIKRMRDEGIVF